jgi:hypothetical protein
MQRARLGAYLNRLEHTVANLLAANENLTVSGRTLKRGANTQVRPYIYSRAVFYNGSRACGPGDQKRRLGRKSTICGKKMRTPMRMSSMT